MEPKLFKALTIAPADSRSRKDLAEAFNEWAEDERPASIVHVHYFHDPELRARGYPIISKASPEGTEHEAACTFQPPPASLPDSSILTSLTHSIVP
ncbi:MAG: hypothetical protein LAO07_01045 [Acidobacteriia bacterium]|nr:hypothetical protein [Terriglobia bacterium]